MRSKLSLKTYTRKNEILDIGAFYVPLSFQTITHRTRILRYLTTIKHEHHAILKSFKGT